MAESFDIIIQGGTVLDGIGGDPFRADVGVADDLIIAVGDLGESRAGRRIDAANRRVAPGFIDIHTHSDMSIAFHPQMESILSQGVTTQVVGNCSLCVGLATDADIFAFEKRWLGAHGARIVWNSFEEHLRFVEEHGVGTNYAMLAGQGTLRKRVMGLDERKPSPDEMAEMKRLLAAAMESGAWGVSTGLEYTPSGYADVDELSELSVVAAEYGGIYATHLRNEGDRLVEAVQEALEIGERAGIPVQLSHHKAEGRRNWGKVKETLRMVEEARARCLDVQLDQYPYTAFQTAMSVQFLPPWANVGDNETMLGRLSDSEQRRRILEDIRANHADWDDLGLDSPWNRVEIGMCRSRRELQGRSIGDLARDAGQNPIEYVLDLILEQRNFISAINFAISEEDIAFVMKHPLTMIGSDAVGTAPRGKMGEDKVHPRSYGTFPRVLGRYVRENGILTESEAVKKMTSMPADRLGLPSRGRIARHVRRYCRLRSSGYHGQRNVPGAASILVGNRLCAGQRPSRLGGGRGDADDVGESAAENLSGDGDAGEAGSASLCRIPTRAGMRWLSPCTGEAFAQRHSPARAAEAAARKAEQVYGFSARQIGRSRQPLRIKPKTQRPNRQEKG